MPKFLTFDIIKCLTGVVVAVLATLTMTYGRFSAAEDLTSPLPEQEIALCGELLGDLSFEKVLDDYAQLVFALESTPADTAGHILLESSLENKRQQLGALVRKEDHDRVKLRILSLLRILRGDKNLRDQDDVAQEAEQRRAEERLLNLDFQPSGPQLPSEHFDAGVLSLDGKSFLMMRNEGFGKKTFSLVSLVSGAKIWEKTYEGDSTIKFINGGAHLLIHDQNPTKFYRRLMDWRILQPLGDLLYTYLVSTKIVDVSSGQMLISRKQLSGNLRFFSRDTKISLSPMGDMVLVVKEKKIKLINLVTKKGTSIKYRVNGTVDGSFDFTGKNILIWDSEAREPGGNKITSYNIEKKWINWQKEATSLYVTNEGQFVFEKTGGFGSADEGIILLDILTGKKLRGFKETNLLKHDAVASPDLKLIFIPPSRSEAKAYVFETENNSPGVPLDKFPKDLRNAAFFDNNTKLSGAVHGTVYVWDTTSGILFPPVNSSSQHFFGVDGLGNLMGASSNSENSAFHRFKNPQIRREEK